MLNFNWLTGLRNRIARKRQRRSLLAFSERLEKRSMLTAFTVTSTEDAADADPGDGAALTAAGETTLRAAIEEAKANPGADLIEIPAGLFELTRANAGDGSTSNGSLDITDDVQIRGAGPVETTLDASQIDTLFDVAAGVTLQLEDLSLSGQPTLREGALPGGGNVELDNVSQSELPAGALAAELLDPVELFLIDLAQSEAEDELEEDSSPEDDLAFPRNDVQPLRTSARHTELLDSLFDQSRVSLPVADPVLLPLIEKELPRPEPVSKPDILNESARLELIPLRDESNSEPVELQITKDESVDPDSVQTAKNETKAPRGNPGQREEVIKSLFEQKGETPDSIQQTSGSKPGDEQSAPPARLPISTVPFDEDGHLLLQPIERTSRRIPPPLPEVKDDGATTAVDAVATPVAATAAAIVVPASWKQRWRKRMRYWESVVS